MAWKEKALYHLYVGMLKRCFRPATVHYDRYGGRGITVCERWRIGIPRGQGFKNFKEDMGPRPDGYTIERLDNDGNYTPENCKWVPREQQYRNRCTNIYITFRGETLIATDWARRLGYKSSKIITNRIAKGIPIEIALTAKRMPYNSHIPMVNAAAEKKRAQTHCKRGHLLSGPNVTLNKQGWRTCKTCKREEMARRRAKR